MTFRLLLAAATIVSTTCRADDFPTPPNTEKSSTAPLAPAEVARSAKLPPGFQLSVFAAEPDVQNPIAITTDERGRLWVVENYTWAGSNLGVWDTNLKDRIVILEDTDGDGRHDKRTVFWDQGRKSTSVEVGFGGVWVMNSPHLLFIPDQNRDDVPDGPPVVVLDGIDEHAVGHTPANGLKWGPDGWLYARHGIQGTSSIGRPGASDSQRIKINTGVWRYHPTRQVVEDVLHGMTNSWGFDFTEHGEMFVINTVIGHLWHVVPGARVQRMYGADLNPHCYELIEQTADHVHWDTGEVWNDVRKGVTDKTSAAGGGHAHIGLMIYQGDNWPAEYRGGVFTLNLHGQRINTDRLERDGAGYTARHGEDFCFLSDPWYRGMDLITAPDGGVYVSDWSDTGECHDHDGVHRGSGRIYKLTYGTPKRVAPFDLTKQSDDELLDLQQHANAWWPRQARRVLQERAAARPADATQLQAAIATRLAAENDLVRRLRLLWTAEAAGTRHHDNLEQRLRAADNEHERVWLVRLAVERYSRAEGLPPALADWLARWAGQEPSGLVQLYLASALQRINVDRRWELAEALSAHSEFAGDRMLPLMIWYGIEPAIVRDSKRALQLIATSPILKIRRHAARRLTEEIETQPGPINDLVALAAGNPSVAEDVLVGMADALRGWSKAPQPTAWTSSQEKLTKLESSTAKTALRELGVVFGDGRAMAELHQIVTNGEAEPAARRQALRTLLTGKPENLLPLLLELSGDRVLAGEAIRGLAQYDHPDTPARLAAHWPRYSPAERTEAINTLCSRPAYARALLALLAEGQITKQDVSAFHARQIQAFGDDALHRQLTDLWGEVRVTSADKRAQVEYRKTQLTAETLAHAQPAAGRKLFAQHCANCHVLFGAGRQVGPDLTGSNRKNLDYLLENLIDPSASVGGDFRAWVVVLDDGRVLNGVITDKNDRTLTLQTAQEPITLDRQSIDELKQTSNSLMPDGLLQNLTDEQVRDLVSYLMSSEQVSLAE